MPVPYAVDAASVNPQANQQFTVAAEGTNRVRERIMAAIRVLDRAGIHAVLFEISLVVLLGTVKAGGWRDLGDDLTLVLT
jgi:uncharacterized membrane protein